ncbi:MULTISPECIES: MarR family transcriptional regulator [Clostridium]|uniref:MarR family transcriptional regulator n=1 Tax=Clostridium botulinum TaxID=1491 RepID=A0A6B4QTD2_CLOBO|nr:MULTISPECIES: MarR family transcriptional regulator [Clostridium]ACD53036.1 transcriptional regulator, MarR family [Clostridium botulinum E3 str. Alaska E43]AJF29087.1 MarR family transcriptional regulator [Clostridium botulinum]AJF32148.1 MarR family transcriptional regulator [Clostridium botulinum]EES50447.1 transcriptional regulator, MarR family [Clostridium botulinum E1 str. 'BoNT E Beluga']KIL09325.1 MarR family transcriptional regulator [Clostridium botulinum]
MLEQNFCECLFFTATRLKKIAAKIAEDELKPLGLSPTYVYILLGVKFKSGITQKELSEELHLKPSTITRLIDKLVINGLVERRAEGKLSHIYLTNDGEKIQEDIQKYRLKLHNRYREILGEDYNLLTKITNDSARILESK